LLHRGDEERGGGMMGGFGGSMGGVAGASKAKRPINVKFEIPYFTTSGIQVRYLKIIEPKVCLYQPSTNRNAGGAILMRLLVAIPLFTLGAIHYSKRRHCGQIAGRTALSGGLCFCRCWAVNDSIMGEAYDGMRTFIAWRYERLQRYRRRQVY